MSGLSLWNLRREIQITHTRWSKPRQHDAIKYAKQGEVLIGHEFERTIQSAAIKHKQEGIVEEEVAARPTARLVGFTRPFFLDLVNAVSSHLYCLGGTGFGKTWFGKALIVRVWNALRIPSLLLDWKGEYSPLIARMGGLVLKVPESFTINPLKLDGKSPVARAEIAAEDLTGAVKLSALQAGEVVQVIMQAYRERGITEENTQTENESKTPPTIEDVMEILSAMRAKGEFKGTKADSVGWTIDKLRLVKRIFKSEDVEFFNEALRRPCAIDISELSDLAKMLVIFSVLRRIYEHCSGMKLSKLRLLVVMDEAHLILKTKTEEKMKYAIEPLPVRLVREGRKYGFGIVLLSQLATDILVEAAANVAFVVALCLGTDEQNRKVCNWIGLSRPEREIYRTLPVGGAFIKEIGTQNARLVRIQALDEEGRELAYARALCRQAIGKTSPNVPKPRTSLHQWYYETVKTPVETRKQIETPIPTETLSKLPSEIPTATALEPEPFTLTETQVLRVLETKPYSMTALQAQFPKLTYEELLKTLHGLEGVGRIQVTRVPNLAGKSTVYYSQLQAAWIQSEGIEHRAMADMTVEALARLRAVRYINIDCPDVGLELAQPKTALEFETGRKKLTDAEIDAWAKHIKERNLRLGYECTIVIVLNMHVLRRYKATCARYGLEVTTMAKLLSLLGEP
jgi:hypothetical protein